MKVFIHKPSAKAFIPFLLFFATLGGLTIGISIVPFIIFGWITGVASDYIQPTYVFVLFSQVILPLTLYILVPLIVTALFLIPLVRAKKRRDFFIGSFLLFLFAYMFTEPHIFLNQTHIPLRILLLVCVITFSLTSTYVWNEIFLNKHYKSSPLLLIPLVVDFALILIAMSLLFEIYKMIGEYLFRITSSQVNIFWLDFGGFGVLFVNLINCVLASILFKAKALMKKDI